MAIWSPAHVTHQYMTHQMFVTPSVVSPSYGHTRDNCTGLADLVWSVWWYNNALHTMCSIFSYNMFHHGWSSSNVHTLLWYCGILHDNRAVKEYCVHDRVRQNTWYHINHQYDQWENKSNSRIRCEITVNLGILAETVKHRLLNQYEVQLETLSRVWISWYNVDVIKCHRNQLPKKTKS